MERARLSGDSGVDEMFQLRVVRVKSPAQALGLSGERLHAFGDHVLLSCLASYLRN